MRLFNLLSDPKEETDIKDANPWVQSVTDRIVERVQRDDRSAIRTCRPTRRIRICRRRS